MSEAIPITVPTDAWLGAPTIVGITWPVATGAETAVAWTGSSGVLCAGRPTGATPARNDIADRRPWDAGRAPRAPAHAKASSCTLGVLSRAGSAIPR